MTHEGRASRPVINEEIRKSIVTNCSERDLCSLWFALSTAHYCRAAADAPLNMDCFVANYQTLFPFGPQCFPRTLQNTYTSLAEK